MSTKSETLTILKEVNQYHSRFSTVAFPNKPVIGGQTPMGHSTSSLFYWSHALFTEDFEFGLHPHAGFEIMTFILEGQNSHFDTESQKWIEMNAGDFQIINTGYGISHNEKVKKNSRAFQIYFDPDYKKSITQEPIYRSLNLKDQKSELKSGYQFFYLVGENSRATPKTEGLSIQRLKNIDGKSITLDLKKDYQYFFYVINGNCILNENLLNKNDLVIAKHEQSMVVQSEINSELFIITLPNNPSYKPVSQRR